MSFDVGQIVNLVGQLDGDQQQAAQQLQGMGQVDPQQHAGLLTQLGIAPQQPGFGGSGRGYESRGGQGYEQGGQGFEQQGGQGCER